MTSWAWEDAPLLAYIYETVHIPCLQISLKTFLNLLQEDLKIRPVFNIQRIVNFGLDLCNLADPQLANFLPNLSHFMSTGFQTV